MQFRLILIAAACLVMTACTGGRGWGARIEPERPSDLEASAPVGQLEPVATPAAYAVKLTVDPRTEEFSGDVQIDVDVSRPVPGLWLHGDDLEVSRVTAKAGNRTLDATWTEVLPTGVVWVGFPRMLKGGRVQLSISYTAAFDRELSGLFKVESNDDFYALAKSESIQARRFLPSFDEPGYKAPFDVSLTVPEGMHAIANTPETARGQPQAGFDTIHFAKTRPLSTYLLSVAVGPFDKIEREPIPASRVRKNPIPLTGYARRGKAAELDYALSITPSYVIGFEEAFQQPWPYEKLDIIAAPQWPSGATELAAAITYREDRILRSESTGAEQVLALEQVHAHEIAHAWFGNIVTPPWWNDLWLKEAFASWSESMLHERLDPASEAASDAVRDSLSAMALDALPSARAIADPIARNEDIRNAYDSITYRKGLAVIRMIDTYFGGDRFRPALSAYIEKYKDKSAGSPEFFKIMGEVTNDPRIEKVFSSFVTKNGLPVIAARLKCTPGGSRVEIAQSRFVPAGLAAPPAQRWTMPVCISGSFKGKRERQCIILEDEQGTIEFDTRQCPDYVVPNDAASGYYRGDLESSAWEDLTAAFTSLPESEALWLIDSARASTELRRMAGQSLLRLIEEAAKHPSELVRSEALSQASDLLVLARDTRAASGAKNWAAGLANTFQSAMGGSASASASDLSRLAAFRALRLDHSATRADLFERLKAYMAGQDGREAPALTSDEFAAAIAVTLDRGGSGVVDVLLTAMETRDDSSFGAAVIAGLGASKEPAQIARAQAIMQSGEYGPSATFNIAQALMTNDRARESTWSLLNENFETFVDQIPAQWQRNTPRLAIAFCDPARANEVKAFFDQYGGKAEGHAQALAETLDSLPACAATRANLKAELEAAFTAR